ncbi:hypothetical protein [Dechloromonas sp. A34]|uniref:hypothetical protein n=1 Tax=Dechloromonas sp. A34 TaxID=447588 RepID=UPI00224901E2|nr:hypothetical protein [Dechloromonas sp. A34]
MRCVYSIAEGDVLCQPETRIRYRVLYLMRDEAIVFNVDAPVAPKSVPPSQRKKNSKPAVSASAEKPMKPALPELMPLAELIQWRKEHWHSVIRTQESLTGAEKRFHARASAVVELLHQDEPAIYYSRKRAKLIALAVEKFKLTQRTVWKYLRAYWQAGKETSALFSKLSNCGAAGKLRPPGSLKRGCPRSLRLQEKIGPGINVKFGDQPNINKALDWYRAHPEKTLEYAYFWMLDAFYSGEHQLPDGTKAWGANPREVMTFAQFDYHAARYFKPEDKERRDGERNKGSKVLRERYKGTQVGRYEVGEIAEVDALHCNISLVSSSDRAVVLGGMVVFIVVDYSSGLVMGFSAGWDGEPYESCADALVKCAIDKVEWCAQYDIQIESDAWPIRHWPQHFHTDRGSAFMCGMADLIVEVMRPNPFANTPPMSPESKGIVENTVKLIKLVFRVMYPGTWLAKVGSQKRGVKSPHYKAVMTRYEFIRAFMKVVLEVNGRLRRTATQPQLVARGVANTSVAICLDALRTHRHRLRRIDPLRVEAELMTRLPGRVSDKGIYLGDELYYLPDDTRHLSSTWFKRLVQDGAAVSLALNREIVDIAFLCRSGKEDAFIPCSLSPRSAQFTGMSLHEVKTTRTLRNELDTVERHNTLTQRMEHLASMQRDGKEAQAKTREALGNIPDSERDIGNRRENRRNERALERQKLGADLRQRHGGTPQQLSKQESDDDENYDYPDIDD